MTDRCWFAGLSSIRAKRSQMVKRLLAIVSIVALGGCGSSDVENFGAGPQALAGTVPGPGFVAASQGRPLTRTLQEDGKILWRHPVTGAVTAVGYGTHEEVPIATASNLDWDLKGTGDLDGDGQDDFLWQNRSTRALGVWYMNGLQIARVGSLPTPSSGWQLVGIRTGSIGILWFNPSSRVLAAWTLSSGKVTGAFQYGTVPSAYRPILVNRRGLVTQDSSNRLYNFALSNLDAPVRLPVPAGPSPICTADMNSDTWDDLMFQTRPGRYVCLSSEYPERWPRLSAPRQFHDFQLVGALNSIFDGSLSDLTEIRSDATQLRLTVGDTHKIKLWNFLIISPNAKITNFTASSDNPSVATVDAAGQIRAVGPGRARVSASSAGLTATLSVDVQAASPLLTPPDSGLELVDLNDFQISAGNTSSLVSMSSDGLRVGFSSSSPRLLDSLIPIQSQAFIRDRLTGVATCVSLDSSGAPANGPCSRPLLSVDGRYNCFLSRATNLGQNGSPAGDLYLSGFSGDVWGRVVFTVSGGPVFVPKSEREFAMNDDASAFVATSDTPLAGDDTNGRSDIYLAGAVASIYNGWPNSVASANRVSVQNDGSQFDQDSRLVGLSGDGKRVAFELPSVGRVFVRYLALNRTEEVGLAGIPSLAGAFSADGRYLLVAKSDSSGYFVKDLTTSGLIPVDLTNGHGNPLIANLNAAFSRDGRFLCFTSDLPGIVNIPIDGRSRCYIHDRNTGRTRTYGAEAANTGITFSWTSNGISADGRFLGVTAISDLVNGANTVDTSTLLNPFAP